MIVLNFRSTRETVTVLGFFTYKLLLLPITVTLGLQACAVYVPFLQNALHTTSMGWEDWAIIVLVSVPIFILTELYKWVQWKLQ